VSVELTPWQTRYRRLVTSKDEPYVWPWEGWRGEGWFALGEVLTIAHWKLQDLDRRLVRLSDHVHLKRAAARKAARA
jgi:hypothetical protein